MLLNADVGEGFGPWSMGDDKALIPHIHLANIACGGHASDPLTMQKTVRLALDHEVELGAHPSYPDMLGFGRRPLAISPGEAALHMLAQVGALEAIARSEGGSLTYVKPHGALYNEMMASPDLMAALMSSLADYKPELKLMILATSHSNEHQTLAHKYGIELILEAFADRSYTDEGHLAKRTSPGAVFHDSDKILAQAHSILTTNSVKTNTGSEIQLGANVICVHGDNTESIGVVEKIRSMIDSNLNSLSV